MKYLKKYEEYNVQDIMSYPTSIQKTDIYSKEPNVQDMMTIPTQITKQGNKYEDVFTDFVPSLQPFYEFIRSLRGIKDLTNITYEQLDNYAGFSFVAYYARIMILSDKKDVYILISGSLIPIDEPTEIIKILENEA